MEMERDDMFPLLLFHSSMPRQAYVESKPDNCAEEPWGVQVRVPAYILQWWSQYSPAVNLRKFF